MWPSWLAFSLWCHKLPQTSKLSWQPSCTQCFSAILYQSDYSSFPGNIVLLFLDFCQFLTLSLNFKRISVFYPDTDFFPLRLSLFIFVILHVYGQIGWLFQCKVIESLQSWSCAGNLLMHTDTVISHQSANSTFTGHIFFFFLDFGKCTDAFMNYNILIILLLIHI